MKDIKTLSYLLLTILISKPALANPSNNYFSTFVDSSRDVHISFNKTNQIEAKRAALTKCQKKKRKGCKHLLSGKERFIAITSQVENGFFVKFLNNNPTPIGIASGDKVHETAQKAIGRCENLMKQRDKCHLKIVIDQTNRYWFKYYTQDNKPVSLVNPIEY